MNKNTFANLYTALMLGVLLILTAWGNPVVMFIVAALGVVAGLLIFGRSFAKRGAVAAAVGFVVAATVALML